MTGKIALPVIAHTQTHKDNKNNEKKNQKENHLKANQNEDWV